jgi:two-component system chemotaxis sensor kinase CheA
MTNSGRLENLLTGVGMEILSARTGSLEGQLPILDLLGNLRDEAAKEPGLAELSAFCQQAWERMIVVVESGQPFAAEVIVWLKDALARLQALAGAAANASSTETPSPTTPEPAAPAPAAEAPSASHPAGEHDEPFELNLASDEELLREFVVESREHLDNIENGVLELEGNPDDGETLNTVFRAFHTFKGGAGFLNLVPINRLAHVLESLLDLARQRKLAIDKAVIDLILRGRDTLRQFLEEIDGQLDGSRQARPIDIPTSTLKCEVQWLIEQVSAGVAPPGESGLKEDRSQPDGEAGAGPDHPGDPPAEPAEESPAPLAARAGALPPPQTALAHAASGGSHAEHGAIVKVETGKLDALLDLVGEMVISQSLVAQDLSGLANLNPQFARNMAQLSRTTKDLQRMSMSMRMVQIRGAFQKMARVVRDIGAKQNKKVRLITHGEETELDRNVVEQLNDPLLHIIRNSMDHGIESAEARLAAGKPAVGTISLRASHQGGNIIIEITDDGKGLDRDRILAKAVERGLAAPGAQLADDEVYAFIFAAGFSTAEKVTDLSGRGVGLDVVRRNLEQLRGSVDISSVRGKGTQFKLALPLTLAIIDGLVVKVGEERYIVPALSVRESFRPTAEMITSVHQHGEVVNVRGRLIPLLRLYELFGVRPASKNPVEGIGVVVQSGASTRCLLVDALVAKQEVVIKNLNDLMVHKNRSLAGAAILGDGRVGLILDVNSLVHAEANAQPLAA